MAAFTGRIPFVGREPEMGQLQDAFTAAAEGHGALVMVVGEPGIGKTTLCRHLSTFAEEHGGRVLVGHCYEEGSLSLPYLPFVEALRAYVLRRAPAELAHELGDGAAEVARIVPEVRGRIHLAAEPATPPDPEEARYRLLQAVATFLGAAAAAQPLVIVLEDLHDADQGTLDLLRHLARGLADTHLLLIGTYRDIEVDRTHPLSGALAELRRVASFERLALRGLTADQVRRMIEQIAGRAVPPDLAAAVHRQTEGNPLFAREVTRYLVEEGLVGEDGGRAAGALPAALSIPEGLRDVIGKRLTRLSQTCNRVLGIAAVIGREFDLGTLIAVAALPEEELLTALEEAVRAAVLEEHARPGVVRYRFAHAFFRQTLYEELIAPRRLRLHQQVARALETQYAGRLDDHSAELADHFAQSTDLSDLAKAVEYGERAARRAMAVYAYGEAARLLEQALGVQEVLDPDDRAKRCDLLLALGAALLAAGQPMRAVDEAAPEAFALAEALADVRRASGASQLALRGLNQYGAGQVTGIPQYRLWVERADHYAPPGTIDRVYADIFLATTYERTQQAADAWPLYVRALELARTLQDWEPLFFAAACLGWSPRAPQYRRQMLHVAEEFAARPREGVTVRTLALVLALFGGVYLDRGDRARAEELWRELEELAVRARDASTILVALGPPIIVARLDGQLEAVITLGERFVARADGMGMPVTGRQNSWLVTWRAYIDLGRLEEALAAVPEARRAAGLSEDTDASKMYRACILAHAGRVEPARDELTRCLAHWDIGSDEADTSTFVLSTLLETAVLVEDREAADVLSHRLAGVADSAIAMWAWGGTCVARHLGAAAALLDRPEEARAYYLQALDVARRIRFRPEVALTHLQLAELLVERYPAERDEALKHLELALPEFQAMKMQPALERAMRLRARVQRLGDPPPPPTPPPMLGEGSPSLSIGPAPTQDREGRQGSGTAGAPGSGAQPDDGGVRVAEPPDWRTDADPGSPPPALGEGSGVGAAPDRILATVLFTDIVGSTERAAALGDRRWRELKEQHHALVRRELARFRGREIDTAGDGFFAVFDAPARAIRCACAVRDAVRSLGIEIRAGLHLGEVEMHGDSVTGIAVHIGARVEALAGPGEVLATATVRDLVAGAGIRFADRGAHALKGLPGEWTLFRVEGDEG